MRTFVEAARFVLLATADATGATTVSPKGGPAGFVRVLDERRLAIPDHLGNNLLDSLHNLLVNPHAGLLFVLPGQGLTLRVDGRAWITADPAVLDTTTGDDGRRPKIAIGIEITEAFLHRPASFRRAEIWDPTTWTATDDDD